LNGLRLWSNACIKTNLLNILPSLWGIKGSSVEVHKIKLIFPNLRQKKPVHNFQTYFPKDHFNVTPSLLSLRKDQNKKIAVILKSGLRD
jgi:hypothetical protein